MDVPQQPQQQQQPQQPSQQQSQQPQQQQQQAPPSLASLLVTFLVLILGLVIALSAGYFKQIFANFSSYRCNPLMMPFAGFFGYNATENFQFCLNNILQGRLAEAFGPLFSLLGSFGTTLETVVNAALGLRKLFSNFLMTVNGFIANVKDRIQMLMTQVRLSFLKIKELMGKVYGTMYAVIWMGTSGLAAAGNMADNGIVKFMMEFCFAPDTAVQLEDGSYKTMETLEIGDRLAPLPSTSTPNTNPVVTSLFRFDGSKTPMVRIGDVVVSASHFVEYDGQMMEATEHPHAIPLPSLPVLCCLNVTGHRFQVGRHRNKLVAADYDEDDSEEVVRATQAVAAAALNGAPSAELAVADYSLGLSNDAEVRMKDGTWKRVGDVRLGDVTEHAGAVKGLVKEACESVVETPCGPMAAAQLVWSAGMRQWQRAAAVWPLKTGTHVLSHLITERCGALELRGDVFVRDYREAAVPEMEEAYAAKVRAPGTQIVV